MLMPFQTKSFSALRLCLAAAVWFAGNPPYLQASQPDDYPKIAITTQSAEIDAGIACLERAATLLGAPIDTVALLRSPLLQSPSHDQTRQLAALAVEQNLHAVVLDRVTAKQINDCPYPMLIHVYGAQYSTKPDYYVLCAGAGDGRVDLFSPSRAAISVPLSEFEEDRRGEAVVLSRRELVASDRMFHRTLPMAQLALMTGLVLCAGLLSLAQRRRPADSRAARSVQPSVGAFHCLLLFSIAVVLAFVDRIASGRSVVPPPPAPAGKPIDFLLPASAHSETPSRKLAEISLETALARFAGGALFVDARDVAEYEAGHIRGAMCCPATDISRWRLHLAGIDPHRPIVVYCAMASCKKGEYVATFLLANGFTDVCLYREGWAKWTGAKEGK